jgi:hypothetical protein
VLRDLVHAPAEVVAAERARVATEGWGAGLLALQGEDGQWAGGACFPARFFDQRDEYEYFRSVGDVPDARMDEAIDLLRSKQRPDGTWLLANTHPGKVHFALEDGDGRPSRWNTLRALRVLSWYEQSAT